VLAWLAGGDGIGRLVPLESATVSVLDRGLTVGAGAFETLKVVEGVPFALSRHLRRLQHSATALAIDMPAELEIRHAVAEVLRGNEAELGPIGRMRITLTPGSGTLADPYSGAGPTTLLITVTDIAPWPQAATVAISDFRRNAASALTGVKSTSYAENAIALRHARQAGAHEALLLNTMDDVCEGTGSNIFVVIDGEVRTPPLASGCLAGITRDLVLLWCGGRETAIPADQLPEVSEAFLTSSTRDIWPIATLAGRSLPAPGPVTQAVMTQWSSRIAADVDP